MHFLIKHIIQYGQACHPIILKKFQTPIKEHVWKHKINTKLIQNVAPTNPDHPYLDVFQLTNSCNMENCSYDGGHRSRYVNRWKAQLLLNTLCEYLDVNGNGENSTNKY